MKQNSPFERKPPGRPNPAPPAPRPAARKGRPGRVTNGLVGLSSVAIFSVFGAGYLRTRSADDQASASLASLVSPTVLAANPSQPQVMPTPSPTPLLPPATSTAATGTTGQSLPQTAPTAVPTPTRTIPTATATARAAGYRDGTYVGLGTSRHGNIEATVVVQGGKIVSANITSCMTRYPCSKVSSLPGRVVATQSVPADYVSGATDSSRAYKQAVTNALAQAG